MATTVLQSSTGKDLCSICQTLTDGKPKPGILPCLGCQQIFCYQHIGEHRQYLADQLDTVVVNERNNLVEIISKLEENCDEYTMQQVKEIDDWELKSNELIRQVAENVRRQLHRMALEECDHLRARFGLLSTELNDKREAENYFEKDIEVLRHKFKQLKYDIENISLKVDTNEELQTMELINIKKKPSSSDSFIDHLLMTQKPVKSINLRNNGKMYGINENLLAFDQYGARDIDLYNTTDGSLKTMSRLGEYCSELCYSTYLQSFLYTICLRRPQRYELYQWSIITNREPEQLKLNNEKGFFTMTCYETNLVGVLHDNTIEKWKLNGLKLEARWRTPMSCEHDESIIRIKMNSQYYALMIKKCDDYYFQLRNSTMSIIGSVKVGYGHSLDLISLPNESGWLMLTHDFQNRKSAYVIDNQLNVHEQKHILSENVSGIVVQGKTVIIRYTEQKNDGSKTKRGRIEYYEWK
ncbi:unnamed protein product [Adineta steineri]|uniref:B box-type domain-containing protein n=1 Tax=Adineta steineri TaxID=433720 RepID=A0A814UU53_9BILA|nr:unnamed protein product [Adineta steineri]CAF3693415.1 unnamed protein product [Adineta steineri]